MTLKISLVFRCKLNLKLEMTKERLTRQEEHSENDGTAELETPNPMDSIMKELVQMRKENKKLHQRQCKEESGLARGGVHLSILVVQ